MTEPRDEDVVRGAMVRRLKHGGPGARGERREELAALDRLLERLKDCEDRIADLERQVDQAVMMLKSLERERDELKARIARMTE